jgi:uncharacterized MnhB-related membrane protein
MLLSMLAGLMVFSAGALIIGRGNSDPNRRAGALLWGLVGGLVAYIYTILQMPGSAWVLDQGSWAGLTATLLGAVLAWVLYQLLTSSRPRLT